MNPINECWTFLKAPVDDKKFAFEEEQRRREKAAQDKKAREAQASQTTQTTLNIGKSHWFDVLKGYPVPSWAQPKRQINTMRASAPADMAEADKAGLEGGYEMKVVPPELRGPKKAPPGAPRTQMGYKPGRAASESPYHTNLRALGAKGMGAETEEEAQTWMGRMSPDQLANTPGELTPNRVQRMPRPGEEDYPTMGGAESGGQNTQPDAPIEGEDSMRTHSNFDARGFPVQAPQWMGANQGWSQSPQGQQIATGTSTGQMPPGQGAQWDQSAINQHNANNAAASAAMRRQ